MKNIVVWIMKFVGCCTLIGVLVTELIWAIQECKYWLEWE